MNMRIILFIFALLTFFLIYLFLRHDPIWGEHSDEINLEKVHDFFEAFGALATASAFFIAFEQMAISRRDFIARNDAILEISLNSVRVRLDGLGLENELRFIFENNSEKSQLSFVVGNRGPGAMKSLRVAIFQQTFSYQSINNGEIRDSYFPLLFNENVTKLVLGEPIDPEDLNNLENFRFQFSTFRVTLDDRGIQENVTFNCRFTRISQQSGRLNFARVV